jgi:hypothetical protein
MSQEDALAKAAMESNYYDQHRLEVPYNHYGTRGVVDFVGVENPDDERGRYITAIEYKSESAVNEATGANEIIRQFTRQVEYFDSRDDFGGYQDNIHHVLSFYLTEANIKHVEENKELYGTLRENYDGVSIAVAHPDTDAALPVTKEGVLYSVGVESVIEAEKIDEELLQYS